MYLDLLILSRLSLGPAHGYEIKKHISHVLGGTVGLNNNVLYPALRRFEESGAIEQINEEPTHSSRLPRRVFRITPSGEDQFQSLLEESGSSVVGDDAEFKARVAFFDRMEPVVRRQLLAGRHRVLQDRLSSIVALRSESATRPWAVRVVDFEIDRVRCELEWIDELAGATTQTSSRQQRSANEPVDVSGTIPRSGRRFSPRARETPARRTTSRALE